MSLIKSKNGFSLFEYLIAISLLLIFVPTLITIWIDLQKKQQKISTSIIKDAEYIFISNIIKKELKTCISIIEITEADLLCKTRDSFFLSIELDPPTIKYRKNGKTTFLNDQLKLISGKIEKINDSLIQLKINEHTITVGLENEKK